MKLQWTSSLRMGTCAIAFMGVIAAQAQTQPAPAMPGQPPAAAEMHNSQSALHLRGFFCFILHFLLTNFGL